MEFRGIQAAHELLQGDIERRIRAVFDHGKFIAGPEVAEFEGKLADYVGVKHCIGCGNGTDALSLILEALEIGTGDAVFLPGYTFFATAEVVLAAGAQPVIVDVREDGNIDPDALAAAIESYTGAKPRAVIVVDLFGQAADWTAIEAVCERYGLIAIEDAAQAIGGSFRFKKCGGFGVAGATSFFPSKPLGGVGDGGAVLTDDGDLADRVRLIANHGRQGGKYRHVTVGRNSRLDTIGAAVLLAKLSHLDQWVGICEAAARRYNKMLPESVAPPRPDERAYCAWAAYVVTLRDSEVREAVMAELTQRGIPHDIYYPLPLNRLPVLADMGLSLPVAERLSETTLALPIHPFIALEEQLEVVDAIIAGLSFSRP